jgi:hypothetical protein
MDGKFVCFVCFCCMFCLLLLYDLYASAVCFTVNSRFFGFEGNGENERNMCENEKS